MKKMEKNVSEGENMVFDLISTRAAKQRTPAVYAHWRALTVGESGEINGIQSTKKGKTAPPGSQEVTFPLLVLLSFLKINRSFPPGGSYIVQANNEKKKTGTAGENMWEMGIG